MIDYLIDLISEDSTYFVICINGSFICVVCFIGEILAVFSSCCCNGCQLAGPRLHCLNTECNDPPWSSEIHVSVAMLKRLS